MANDHVLLSVLRKKIRALEAEMTGDDRDPTERLRFFYQADDGAQRFETTREHFMGEAGPDGEMAERCMPGNYYVQILDSKGEDGEEEWSEPILGILVGENEKDDSGNPNVMRALHVVWSGTMEDLRCELSRTQKRSREHEDVAGKYSTENLRLAEALRAKNREISDLERQVKNLEEELEEAREESDGTSTALEHALEKFIPIILRKVGFTDTEIKSADFVEASTEIWQAAATSYALRKALREAGAGNALRRLGIGDDPSPEPPAATSAPEPPHDPPPAPPAPSDDAGLTEAE